jgi:hypothetical protein
MREPIDVVVDRFTDHDAFERRSDRTFEQVTTQFEATASVVSRDGGIQVHITVILDTLNAAVADEDVPEVLEGGWFETFERRLRDATTVSYDGNNPAPDVTRGDETMTVEVEFESTSDQAVSDAKAVVDFVEATWIQGLIPGYEYDEPAASLLNRAQTRS